MKLSVFLERLNQIVKDNPAALDYEVGMDHVVRYAGEEEFRELYDLSEGEMYENNIGIFFNEESDNKNAIRLTKWF